MFSPEESPRVQFGLQTNVLSRSDNTIRVALRFFLIQTIRNQCTPLPSTRENFGLYYKTERHKRGGEYEVQQQEIDAINVQSVSQSHDQDARVQRWTS